MKRLIRVVGLSVRGAALDGPGGPGGPAVPPSPEGIKKMITWKGYDTYPEVLVGQDYQGFLVLLQRNEPRGFIVLRLHVTYRLLQVFQSRHGSFSEEKTK